MDQLNLNIGVPLLIQDPGVVYLDTQTTPDNSSLLDKSEEIIKTETLLIDSGYRDSLTTSDTIGDKTVIVNQNESEVLNVSDSNSSKEVTDEGSGQNSNSNSEVYFNGQMVQLLDGTMAFVENPKGGKNAVYTPVRLGDGPVIYLVAGDLLNGEAETETGEVIESDNTEVVSAGTTEPKQEKTKGFQCSYKNCNKSYTSFHHLKVHLRVHTGDKPFRCSVEGCNKAFSTGFGLKTHFRTHNGERPYTCNHENCEKGFKTSGDLQKHIRTHTGERPFLCPIPNCGRSFTTCNICKVHVRTHTGERPYKCTYPDCNKTFASLTNQRNHMRIHSGEKPYVCSVEKCGRRFTEYSSLYKHNMVHRQQPHLCLICGKSFRQASGLMMHTKSAHWNEETFLMVDKEPADEIAQEDEQTAILFVDNIKLEDGVLEDSLFTEFREAAPLNV